MHLNVENVKLATLIFTNIAPETYGSAEDTLKKLSQNYE